MEDNNKMAAMPMNRLMITMGLPMVLSMMLQAFYNIVDSAFVSNMSQNGEEALNALTLAFPIQSLMLAIGVGAGIGAGALLSKCLGQQNREKASRTAGNVIFIGIVAYVVFLFFGIFGTRAYIASQTSNPVIFDLAVSYLRICCVCSVGIICFAIFEKLLQSTGRSMLSTAAQVTGAVINIVLDPILIYGLLGLPELGVRGAAWATVIGQVVSLILTMIFHFKFNKELTHGLRYLKPSSKLIREIYAIALPATVGTALTSVMTYGLNLIFVRIDESMVTAYGLYYKIQQFLMFASFGIQNTVTPIVSFNYGMGNKARIRQGIRYGVIYDVALMAAGLVILEIFAVPFSNVFGLSGQTQELCVSALRIVSVSFVFAGASIALQGAFQALGGGMHTLLLCMFRYVIFVLPIAGIFSVIVGQSLDMAWLEWCAFLISEGLSLIIACVFLRNTMRQKVDTLVDHILYS
ncbi:MAG: MATE family efflux transporter [Lachnospiraceae bacterium]|nr:MATE family efflux transporter [Lachnospiraceae bacterium]